MVSLCIAVEQKRLPRLEGFGEVADTERYVRTYDAVDDAAERWPGWRLEVTDLRGLREMVCPVRKLILVDPARWDTGRGFAHAIAHLDLGHHESTEPMAEIEWQADTLAAIRMDLR